jgi:hypothetical protein
MRHEMYQIWIREEPRGFQCLAEAKVRGCQPFWFSDWHQTQEEALAEFESELGPAISRH